MKTRIHVSLFAAAALALTPLHFVTAAQATPAVSATPAVPAAKPASGTPAKGRPSSKDGKKEGATGKPATSGLKVGDAAPAIKVAKTIKGDAISSFASGTVYVVEFWATWCPPCVTTIPHLTEMAAHYKDKVKVMGVSISEQNQADVAPFVTKMGDKMKYTVVTDDVPAGKKANEGFMSKNWSDAAKRSGIPHAFIVDAEGKIAWIGHPMDAAMNQKLSSLTGITAMKVAGKEPKAKTPAAKPADGTIKPK